MASARAMRSVGICLGLVIMAGLAVLVGLDRQARLAAAERQSRALATGVDRLLQYELRNIERALNGILADVAGDAELPADVAARRRAQSIAGVVSRHGELARIDYFPAQPAAADRVQQGPVDGRRPVAARAQVDDQITELAHADTLPRATDR